MRDSLLERIAGIDLGASNCQVGIDRIGADKARDRQLRDVKGQERGVSAQLHEGRLDLSIG